MPPRAASLRRVMGWEDLHFALATGIPKVSLLSGSPGCGKTTTLLHLARTVIENDTAIPVYVRLGPGAAATPKAVFDDVARQGGGSAIRELAELGPIRILVDAEGLPFGQAAALAGDLVETTPKGVAVWIAVRSGLGVVPQALVDEDAIWGWAPPEWKALASLLRSRKQAALLARLAEGVAPWALRDPFLLGLLSRAFPKLVAIPDQPGPLLDALVMEVAAAKPADRGRQVLVADLLPAMAALMIAEGLAEIPEEQFRQMAFEVAKAARLPLRPQDLAAAGVAAAVLVRKGQFIAFCHPSVLEVFAAWDLGESIKRSGTGPLLAKGHHVTHGGRTPTLQATNIAGELASRLLVRLTKPERLEEVYDLMVHEGHLAALARGLAESQWPAAIPLRGRLLLVCMRKLQANPTFARPGWYDEPLSALIALGGADAYLTIRDSLAASMTSLAGGLEASSLLGTPLLWPTWTDADSRPFEVLADAALACMDRERGYLRAVVRAMRYIDGDRLVGDVADGTLPPPAVRMLLWDALEGEPTRILAGPAAQLGAALLDASPLARLPDKILDALPGPWGLAWLGSLGALAGPAGDPLGYLAWPPRRSEGFLDVIQGLWHQSLAGADSERRKLASEGLDRLLDTFAATWDDAPDGTWDAIPGRPVGRLAHFFLSLLVRHIGEREALRAARGLNSALMASDPESLSIHLPRLREVLRIERAGVLSPRQARLLGVALRFIPIPDRRLSVMFGRTKA